MAEIVVTDEAVVTASEAYLARRYPDASVNANRVRPQSHEFATRAALLAAAPLLQVALPTREQIAEAMHNHWSKTHAWRQGCDEDVCIAIFLDRATAVLALLSPEETKAAQCPENPSGHNRVTALDGDNKSLGYAHCGYCGAVSPS